jgi:signal transduction histidine kinase
MIGVLRGAIATTLLAAVVMALILSNTRIDQSRGVRSLQVLDHFVRADAGLQRDVLLVHAGLLGNDDPLVAQSGEMEADLGQLGKDVRRDRLDGAALGALSRLAAREESLVEQFRSEQALARSSLAVLPVLGALAEAEAGGPELTVPVQALEQSVARLLLASTPEAAQALQAGIDVLSPASAADHAGAATVRQLVDHARLLGRVLPQVDALLHEITAAPMRAATAAVRDGIEARARRLQARAHDTQLTLYAASLLLFGLTVRVLVNLRASLLELEERAAIERTLAGLSALFASSEPEEIGRSIDTALAMIGRQSGVDRVTLVRLDPDGVQRWTRTAQEEVCPAGLLLEVADEAEAGQAHDQAGSLSSGGQAHGGHVGGARAAADAAGSGGGVLHLRALAVAPGPATRRLGATGTHGWAAVRLRRQEQAVGLLSFELVRRRRRWPRSGVQSLRPFAQLVENALERERVAREREALQARLQQAQRLETAGALASGLAHNFNNIVGAVLGHAEMASECVARGESPSHHVGEIRRAAERAGELVDTMLNLGRRDQPRYEVAMSALTAETVSLLRVSLPGGVVLAVHDEADRATVTGRSAELQQVMLNLVRNAAQASREGGRITLRLDRAEVSATRALLLGAIEPGSHLVLSVADAGSGMDAATLGRIFEPFFTTRPAGTGLGLATVADIVRDHGGAIAARSTPGQGSTFEVWLPCGVPGAARTVARRGRGEIVMVVHPDRERLLKIEDTLAALGYEPTGFASCEAALDAIGRAPSLHDAALVDLGPLGGPDGLAVMSRLRALRPGLPLVVTGAAATVARLRGAGLRMGTVVEAKPGTAGLALAMAELFDRLALLPNRAAEAGPAGADLFREGNR